MPTVAVIKGWLQNRKYAVDRINILEESLADIHQADPFDLQNRLDRLQALYSKFEEAQLALETADEAQYGAEGIVTERKYMKISTALKKAIGKSNQNTSSDNNSDIVQIVTRTENNLNFNLPKISIPPFSGEYHNWNNFKDMFTNMVGRRSELTNVEKMYHLKSFLRSQAAALIANLETSSSNYEIAWNTLIEHYDNKALLAHNQIKAMFELPKVSKHSSSGLSSFISQFKQHCDALEALKIENLSDLFCIYLASQKIDHDIVKEFQLQRNEKEVPTLKEFMSYLTKRSRANQLIPRDTNSSSSKVEKKTFACTVAEPPKTNNYPHCALCKGSHFISKCSQFLKLSVNERRKAVGKFRLCFNCLSDKHVTNKCNSQYGGCKKCNQKHHGFLHYPNVQQDAPRASNTQNTRPSSPVAESSNTVENVIANVGIGKRRETELKQPSSSKSTFVLLSTALVDIIDESGKVHTCRALLDNASERNFITSEALRKLNVHSKRSNWSISGVAGANANVSSVVNLTLKSRVRKFQVKSEFGVLEHIADEVPERTFSKNLIKLPPFVKLADPTFNQRGKLDMLIGAGLFSDLLRKGRIKLQRGMPTLNETELGWILNGNVTVPSKSKSPRNSRRQNVKTMVCTSSNASEDLSDLMSKFFKLEEVSSKQILSEEEKLCEKLFTETVSRDESGRYEVDLPVYPERLQNLGNSYEYAFKCFLSLEQRFQKNPDLSNEYKNFIHEYLELKHAHEIENFPSQEVVEYYMPHHAVFKEDSSTTKLRVVFNASAKTATGVSLNDTLMIGPVVQSDLFSVLLRFRTYLYAVMSDVTKMYRQVNVKERYQALQRILWRDSPEEKIRCLQLNTVTYGTASASFLATRALMQLVEDEGSKFPLASKAIKSNSYVDDVIGGSNSLQEALQLQQELINLLKLGQFELHKWYSNSEEILQRIPEEKREKCKVNLSKDLSLKTLGLIWCPESDKFQISFPQTTADTRPTKREILSNIAKIFDPLGLIAPICVYAKIIMQRVWKEKLDWNDPVPDKIWKDWKSFCQNLPSIAEISIPRLITGEHCVTYELHGFADSSTKAYGCAIYLKSNFSNGTCTSRLICAKSRVAPLRPVSLPRLELCAALILVRLMKVVQNALEISIHKTHYYSDSQIAIGWIRSDASRWSVFIANRVAEIQELSSKEDWFHVSSSLNPADLVSRGIEPHLLNNRTIWWNGPDFLKENSLPANSDPEIPLENLPEARASVNVVVTSHVPNDLVKIFEKFSSFYKLQRTFAYVLRFINRVKGSKPQSEYLTTSELKSSLNAIVKIVQREHYHKEIKILSNRERCLDLKFSNLKHLNPFLDAEGILRVGGRIKNAPNISHSQKFPIILPAKDHVVKLIILFEHQQLMHAGAQSVLANLRLRFWIVNGRNEIRRLISKCVKCYKFKASAISQFMGDLPAVRVTPARAFLHSGVDYAGPIAIKQSRLRKSLATKGYICLFVCMVTKAVHLELVSDMSTKTFLDALNRFFSRRGRSAKIYSDNGTNFRGASHELHKLYQTFSNKSSVSQIHDATAKIGVDWNFIPPLSPHWGGIWESGVKSVKHHLKRIMGNTSLTYEELNTLLVQIEGIINSRPLCVPSNDADDLDCLTPAHFLIGDTFTSVPEVSAGSVAVNRTAVREQLECAKKTFWKRWSVEYLSSLQRRNKWFSPQLNIQKDIVVLVKDDNLPSMQWCLGKIVETYPGQDNLIRVVSVKTKNGTFKRPVSKICPLPIENST